MLLRHNLYSQLFYQDNSLFIPPVNRLSGTKNLHFAIAPFTRFSAFLQIKGISAYLSLQQKQEIISKVTDAIASVEGEGLRPVT
jgi:hypothetical protein